MIFVLTLYTFSLLNYLDIVDIEKIEPRFQHDEYIVYDIRPDTDISPGLNCYKITLIKKDGTVHSRYTIPESSVALMVGNIIKENDMDNDESFIIMYDPVVEVKRLLDNSKSLVPKIRQAGLVRYDILYKLCSSRFEDRESGRQALQLLDYPNLVYFLTYHDKEAVCATTLEINRRIEEKRSKVLTEWVARANLLVVKKFLNGLKEYYNSY